VPLLVGNLEITDAGDSGRNGSEWTTVTNKEEAMRRSAKTWSMARD
jgi:hypothetical protein